MYKVLTVSVMMKKAIDPNEWLDHRLCGFDTNEIEVWTKVIDP